MEWMLVNPQIHSMFASLGSFVQDNYVISPDCLLTLDEIWKRLSVEDGTLRTFRRAIGISQVVKKDFLPLLINCKNDDRITDLTIKILAYLTMPVECLLPMEVMLKTDAGRNTIYELNMFLSSCKNAFLDPRATKRVLEHIKSILDKMSDSKVTKEHCDVLNDSVLLLRNILHIPEFKNGAPVTTTQNQILWNMFAQNIDKVLLELIIGESKSSLGLALVQLVALMYKDQHVTTLQKLLNLWFETSISESSEDNESNTSPPERDFGDSSSSMATSDPTSDSSDTNMGETRAAEKEYKENHTQQHNHHIKQQAQNNYNQQQSHNHQERHAHTHHMHQQSHKHHNQQQSHGHLSQLQMQGKLSQYQLHSHFNQTQTHSHHNQQKCYPGNKLHSNPKKNNVNTRNKISKQNNKKQMDSSSSSTSSDKQRPSSLQLQQSNSTPFRQPHFQPISDTQQHLQNNGPAQKNLKKTESMSEHSDCGYGTQLETQESISTSSNDDDSLDRDKKPVHQKPSNMIQKARQPNSKALTQQEKEALRRKKLNRRRRLSSVKALLHHSPSDEDISHLMKEFTVDFLLKGYSSLVTVLHGQLLFNSQAKTQMDSSHFFWLITYFLKFATQLEIDLEHISPVLSSDILFYLTYEGVMLCEQFELAKTKQSDCELAPCIRRMHLVVTAIRELIQSIDVYKKMSHPHEEDQFNLTKIQRQICVTEDVRCLFILMLRQFNPNLQSEQFLKDLVVTNHTLLTFIESSGLHSPYVSLFHTHIKQFAHADVMKQYGLLLEKFQENGQFVNDCIFTIMHHVAADQEGLSTLFQPSILKTFSLICDSDFQLCDDWSDLIEFVINKFIKTPRSITSLVDQKTGNESVLPARIQPQQEWTEEDCHNLYWYYVQNANSNDPVGSVIRLYNENGVINKTRIEVIEKLLQQDIITRFQYQELLEKEPIATIKDAGWDDDEDCEDAQPPDEVETLRNLLIKNNKSELVYWVQKVLLEVCHAKMALIEKSDAPVEPIPFYSTYGRGVSVVEEGIPLVAWNCDQSAIMQYQPFILLLHKLGLHLPADAGKAFARIPHFWPPDHLFATAKKLGPLNPCWLKFDSEAMGGGLSSGRTIKEDDGMTFRPNTATYISYTPQPNIGANWMDLARHSKIINKKDQTSFS